MADIAVTTSRYNYLPSSGIAITFLSLFSVSGAVHLGEALYGRLYWLLPTVVLGLVGEILGWACRYWSTYSQGLARTPWLAQYVTIILAPTFLLAAIFMLLGRMIPIMGQEYSRLKHYQYAIVFCSSDLLALTIQGVGGGMAAASTTANGSVTGGNIALAGIVLQLVSIVIFIVLLVEFLIRFHYDLPLYPRDSSNSASQSSRIEDGYPFSALYTGNPTLVHAQNLEKRKLVALHWKLQMLLAGQSISVLCLLIRSCYRVGELSGGFNSPIADSQLDFDVLDGAMVLIANCMLNIFHPAFLFRRPAPKPAGLSVEWDASASGVNFNISKDDRQPTNVKGSVEKFQV